LEDLTGFFGTGISELSGAKRGYLYITFTCVLFSLVIVLLIWLRQRMISMKQIELEHIQRELEIRKKALEHLTTELSNQKSRKSWLEKEADESYKRALGLKQALEKLRDSLAYANGGDFVSSSVSASNSHVRVRPAVHPPSALLEEIEQLIPALTDNAGTLKSQANLLHDYCAMLEQRQSEMKKIVDHAYVKSQQIPSLLDMSPG
jgi:DNA repair exonuclease SbcCD ATPase subunit